MKKEQKMKKRKNYLPSFKAKVALEAIREEKTIAELAQIYEIHPNLVNKWKKKALENLPGIFSGEVKSQENQEKEDKAQLYKKIGELQMQVDFLKNLPGLS
jgi:transposase-like protein